jgi:glutamate synthase domain-containing protein 2
LKAALKDAEFIKKQEGLGAVVVTDKSERVYHFHTNTMHALAELLGAAGLTHPSQITPGHVMQRTAQGPARPLSARSWRCC